MRQKLQEMLPPHLTSAGDILKIKVAPCRKVAWSVRLYDMWFQLTLCYTGPQSFHRKGWFGGRNFQFTACCQPCFLLLMIFCSFMSFGCAGFFGLILGINTCCSWWVFAVFRRSLWETTWRILQKCVRAWKDDIVMSCRSYESRTRVGSLVLFVQYCVFLLTFTDMLIGGV